MTQRSPIAVVGMSGVFPGAHDLNTFWNNLIGKVTAVVEVPENRWICSKADIADPRPTPDKAYSTRACLINGFIPDLSGLNIHPDAIKALDPLYSLVLHAGKIALGACNLAVTDKDRIGVCLAAIALPTEGANRLTRQIGEYFLEKALFGAKAKNRVEPLFFPGIHQSLSAGVVALPASLLARALGLGGGAYTLDAACGSSIYSVKLACDELSYGRADVMLAGGVSRPDALFTQVGFSQLQALSPSGRCAPFDQTADGLVVGEGVGILALKRLEDALRDKDVIYGLIRGIGLSNDIRGNLLAPDSEGQVRAMQKAYDESKWLPGDVDYIECHGAGTPLGDLVELSSLRRLWGTTGWSTGQCAIGSVKSGIGHLLTGAGAAGMIKTLLGFVHKTLPPSLNFTCPPGNSPLIDSPFKVQTQPEPWPTRNSRTPRRAAVSAFGFGGINGHILLEEWTASSGIYPVEPIRISSSKNAPQPQKSSISVTGNTPLALSTGVAIVGMGTLFGSISSLRDFQEAVFNGESRIQERPQSRWTRYGDESDGSGVLENLQGNFLKEIEIEVGDFHIPPNEIPDILPQQLLMLKVAASAMKDAGLPLRAQRPMMGAVVGIGFDYETTGFHLRWSLFNKVRQWNADYGLNLSESELETWRRALMDGCGPPLTAVRTIGNLGSIVASRISREFQFGGPSFSVSNEAASGLNALEIGVRSLETRETDAVLVGAVDLSGDFRNIILRNTLRPFSKSNRISPFDCQADGVLPGEGAAAMVLMRLEDAIKNGRRIYAVIEGAGKASKTAGGLENQPDETTCQISLQRALDDTGISAAAIGLIETHGSGDPAEDETECRAINRVFAQDSVAGQECAIGSVKPIIGHTGAAAGLASVVKAALCLYQEIIPPHQNFTQPKATWNASRFYVPIFPHYWLKNSDEGPRRALACSLTTDGNCMHVVLKEHDPSGRAMEAGAPLTVASERKRPLGAMSHGLFEVHGTDRREMVEKLDALNTFIHDLGSDGRSMEQVAALWHRRHGSEPGTGRAVSLIAGDRFRLSQRIEEAKAAVLKDTPSVVLGQDGIYYAPEPLGPSAKIAFVYPGSGNHYIGMGREIGVVWPEVLRDMGRDTPTLKTQMLPDLYVPWRLDYSEGWEKDAYERVISDPLNMIFGQVVHGCLMTRVVLGFSIHPHAVIGYSLGQSTGYFAMGVWQDRGDMLTRMLETDLFKTKLSGPCIAARKAWNLPEDQPVDWCAAVVNRSAQDVYAAIARFDTARLLIINTPEQCVIGGRRPDVAHTIRELGCEAVFLDGVVTVHCDAARPVADEYRALHVFKSTPPKNIVFYNCADGCSHEPTAMAAADAVLKQATEGFDFTKTIHQAYADGVSVFIEMGPHASCTGMIRRILKDRPHLAVSASFRGENEPLTILKCLGALIAEGIAVDLDALYGEKAYPPVFSPELGKPKGRTIRVLVGGETPFAFLPVPCLPSPALPTIRTPKFLPVSKKPTASVFAPFSELILSAPETAAAVTNAHMTFLDLSTDIEKTYVQAFDLQNRLLGHLMADPDNPSCQKLLDAWTPSKKDEEYTPDHQIAFSRPMCMEFAAGSVEKVLGPMFTAVDTYPKRVRLPDEPLMLVDRITLLQGEKGNLGPGRIITEHDVATDAWYLDGGKAPVCISVEAGQADLFLCSYLGIDLRVEGRRAYRLLDATVEFHRGLPEPGDTLRYDIHIDRFVRQGETYLFFFHFKGFIRDSLLITMTGGCAGFFTDDEVKNSGGILQREEHASPDEGKRDLLVRELVSFSKKTLSDGDLDQLRKGNATRCFGPEFEGIEVPGPLRLPGGRMRLIDRVIDLDPRGGRFGLGLISAEADIRPDAWYLTCHFQDDQVMPGTLMYECCTHTLRVFVQQMGWIADIPGACYEPKTGVRATLKCRGPVTPQTHQVHYVVEIKQIGADPEPFVIADAHLFADGRCIVFFQDISLKLSNVRMDALYEFWERKRNRRQGHLSVSHVVFSREKLLEFAMGKPSRAFGKPYELFDRNRFIARLPKPPFLLMDRVTRCDPEPWVLKPGGWIQSEFDLSPDHWVFQANRSNVLPYAVLLEIALQPCGWLAAYLGSALKIDKDLKFRNLGGKAVLHKNIQRENTTLITMARLKHVSMVADMIIEEFEFNVSDPNGIVFVGETTFGFFTPDALKRQVGIRDPAGRCFIPSVRDLENKTSHTLETLGPLFPGDAHPDDDTKGFPFAAMPAKALLMIDEIQTFGPGCGPSGLGFIRGVKRVDPDEWFFKAHFYQDPVCPGSLGIESFIQLLKFSALHRWKALTNSNRFEMITGKQHQWTYRGQIIPENKKVEVDAAITAIEESPTPMIMADGFLKVDGRVIYEMKGYGIRLDREGDG